MLLNPAGFEPRIPPVCHSGPVCSLPTYNMRTCVYSIAHANTLGTPPFRMQPLVEPLLRDAAPEPPAGTARLLLTSHMLTKFGSKAWEVRVTGARPSPPQPC